MGSWSATIPREQARPPFFLGVDIGGTNLKLGVVDDAGRPLGKTSIPTEVKGGAENAAARIGAAVRKLLAEIGISPGDVVYGGLGCPGTMDVPSGMLLDPPNLPGWVQFPIRDRVGHHCGLPMGFANDANAAAYGEFWVGSGRAMHSMVMLTLGTGVGGGIIIGDLSVDGEHSCGSECGHVIIDYRDDARRCPCGGTGHLEAYASATALVKRTQEALAAGRTSSLTSRLSQGTELTTLLLAQEAEAGDGLALELILETAMYLATGVVSLMHTIDPDGVVLGGAMTFGGHDNPVGQKFIAHVQSEVQRRAFPVAAAKTIVDFAQLGSDAGYIGAAGIGRIAYRQTLGLRTKAHEDGGENAKSQNEE